jgi:hypothetical protein
MSTAEHINPLSYILEPLVVAGLLTVGCLWNRRSAADLRAADAAPAPEPVRVLPFLAWSAPVPDTARFRGTLASRFLAHFPFLIEVWYWLLTYWVRPCPVSSRTGADTSIPRCIRSAAPCPRSP